ncbi:MAG: ATP-dependent DNA helicase PcrA, partial [Agromyces sp.]
AMPSRYLQEIPGELIDWKQSPGMANSRGGSEPRALNARRSPQFSLGNSMSAWADKPKTEWANPVSAKLRDNGDLTLQAGDRIRHADFGEGTVNQVTGEGTKRIAHCVFDAAGPKKLLIKIAPIEKLG